MSLSSLFCKMVLKPIRPSVVKIRHYEHIQHKISRNKWLGLNSGVLGNCFSHTQNSLTQQYLLTSASFQKNLWVSFSFIIIVGRTNDEIYPFSKMLSAPCSIVNHRHILFIRFLDLIRLQVTETLYPGPAALIFPPSQPLATMTLFSVSVSLTGLDSMYICHSQHLSLCDWPYRHSGSSM